MGSVGMEYDEQSPLRDAYRAHFRAMTEARQAAEKAKAVQSRDPDVRSAIARAYMQEMERIDEVHREWLREHDLTEPPARAGRRPLPAY